MEEELAVMGRALEALQLEKQELEQQAVMGNEHRVKLETLYDQGVIDAEGRSNKKSE